MIIVIVLKTSTGIDQGHGLGHSRMIVDLSKDKSDYYYSFKN
jgi:hypothetical protein